MRPHLLRQPLTIGRWGVTGQDGYGNDVYGVVSSSTVNGYLEQTDAREVTLNRQTYISDWLALLPAGTAIDSNDHITYAGATYEVIGPPNRCWNPRLAAEDHVECRLRSATG